MSCRERGYSTICKDHCAVVLIIPNPVPELLCLPHIGEGIDCIFWIYLTAALHTMNLVWLLAPYIASSIAGDLSGRFDIRHVTNDTFDVLGITKSSFSVQDALFPTSYDSVLYDEFYDSDTKIFLFADACWQPSLNRWNCTLSCKDTSFMFSNLETLHNCMAFPEVAAHYYENNLTQIARALVAQLGIQASRNDSESNRNVTRLIQTCLTDYCTSIKGCHVIYDTVYGAGNENATAYRDPSNWDFREQGSLLMGAICESLRSQAQVNADIGGIGVYNYAISTMIHLLNITGLRFLLDPDWCCSSRFHSNYVVAFLDVFHIP